MECLIQHTEYKHMDLILRPPPFAGLLSDPNVIIIIGRERKVLASTYRIWLVNIENVSPL